MRIIICDNDEQILEKYKALLYKMMIVQDAEAGVSTCGSGDFLLEKFQENIKYAEIILLDIRMPGLDGVQTAKKLREMGYRGEIIFLTHAKDRMLDAFDVTAFHYIVKDETKNDMVEEIITKAIRKVRSKIQEVMSFSCAGNSVNIPINNILYFEVLQRIITVHYGREESFEFYSRLSKLEEVLYRKNFVRIHRAYLVALRHIESVSFKEIKLRNGEILPVGRSYYQQLKERFSQKG